jgi:hypothetical protein
VRFPRWPNYFNLKAFFQAGLPVDIIASMRPPQRPLSGMSPVWPLRQLPLHRDLAI